MLVGEGDVDALIAGAPDMPDLDTEAVRLRGARVLQVLCEIASANMLALLPPGLHPTIPPIVTWLVYDCPESPWGAFRMAQTRIQCRSGARPRGFLVGGVIDSKDAGQALAARWGYRLREGQVSLQRQYDEVRVGVRTGDASVLEVALRDPDPLAPSDLQLMANMNLARTSRGARLVQVDPVYTVERAERGEPVVEHFDAAAWGDARIRPVYPVSASFSTCEVELPKLRYVCLPDVLAFAGTETLA